MVKEIVGYKFFLLNDAWSCAMMINRTIDYSCFVIIVAYDQAFITSVNLKSTEISHYILYFLAHLSRRITR